MLKNGCLTIFFDKIRDVSLSKTVSKCEVNNFTFSVLYFILIVAFFGIEADPTHEKLTILVLGGIYLVNFHQIHDNRFSQDL